MEERIFHKSLKRLPERPLKTRRDDVIEVRGGGGSIECSVVCRAARQTEHEM